MSDAVRSETESKKSGGNRFQALLIGIIVLGLVGLIAYQTFGCAGCYGASWIQ